jgi:hypothetical protein
MELEVHWEWRGFGAVSSIFVDRFVSLKALYPPQNVEDLYLWIPGLEVNAKFRKGAEGGLKFKRLKNRDADLEQWQENPEEVFNFPLEKAGWDALAAMLGDVGITFAPYPTKSPDRATTIKCLEKSGCRTVSVQKCRESRLWQGPNNMVKVEWVCIKHPQATISIGLETWGGDLEGEELSDEQAKQDIREAIKNLRLNEEPLKVMNYMKVVADWASDKKL